MLFNSISFLIFFPLVIAFYFALPYRFRWVLLLIASYYFYMCWKAEYIVLIMASTLVDYFVALKMSEIEEKVKRKKWLYLSLLTNLGLLFSFKYFNFFGSSVQAALNQINIFYEVPIFKYLLPVGISFYTFQTLSYSIDVYNGKVKAEKHLGIFALYVSFFPQLVAGPIERPDRLLPQFRQEFDFNYDRVVSGLRYMLWGFFMKLVIADRVAPIVNEVFNNPTDYAGIQVILATFFFCFQIFCDFAGYSAIAIGAARVMGYDLMENFRRPYHSQSIREFWQRWHISLSSWFRDYVYIPLGGNRVVKWRWYYNLFITFLVSGLWHGANWTFVVWGALHGLYLIIAILTEKQRDSFNTSIGLTKDSKFYPFVQVLVTFLLAWFAWIFFRANNVGDAFTLIASIPDIRLSQFSLSGIKNIEPLRIVLAFLFIFIMEIMHFMEEYTSKPHPLYSESMIVRWTMYILLTICILGFGVYTETEFIYFQF